jgi:hypothetical protein
LKLFDSHAHPQLTSKSPAQRRIALCLFCDVVGHAGAAPDAAQYFAHCWPFVLSGLTDAAAEVRQAAAYCVGVAASNMAACVAPVAGQAAAALAAALTAAPGAPGGAGEAEVRDNVLSSISKLAEAQREALGGETTAAMLGLWLDGLPVRFCFITLY